MRVIPFSTSSDDNVVATKSENVSRGSSDFQVKSAFVQNNYTTSFRNSDFFKSEPTETTRLLQEDDVKNAHELGMCAACVTYWLKNNKVPGLTDYKEIDMIIRDQGNYSRDGDFTDDDSRAQLIKKVLDKDVTSLIKVTGVMTSMQIAALVRLLKANSGNTVYISIGFESVSGRHALGMKNGQLFDPNNGVYDFSASKNDDAKFVMLLSYFLNTIATDNGNWGKSKDLLAYII